MTGGPVAGVVLAAGAGLRIGRPKALVVVAGERLADQAVATLRSGGCDPVLLVTGAAAVAAAGAHTVPNPDWRSGMASSLRVGLAALEAMPDPPDAAVVGLVDQPGIGPEAVRRLIGAYEAGARIAVATYGGHQRNPVLFARAIWSEVAASVTGDRGARDYLAAHADDVTEVECGDVADPADLDTPEDVAAWGRRPR